MQELTRDVFVATEPIAAVDCRDIDFLCERVEATPRRRIRLCAHQDVGDALHEMLIVLDRDTYIRPHKHLNKVESLHVIQGSADAIFFDEEGKIIQVIPLGEYGSGRRFYYRVNTPVYHTLVLRSKVFVFHETTQGPLVRSDTVFAPWSPEETDPAAACAYMDRLAGEAGATAPVTSY